MLNDTLKNAIALKRFSLISPVINKQVENNMSYFIDVTNNPIDMPYYGLRKYSPKTLECWYFSYMKGGLDELKPSTRGDKGNFRKITPELKEKILSVRSKYPKAASTILYETLISEGIIEPNKISKSTIYRFLKNSSNDNVVQTEEHIEMRRFSFKNPGELTQTDVMYGPYIKNGKKREQTYLFGYLDDASRLITHAQFYFSQSFESLRDSFREAVLKRGIPRLVYTDNGKIYRSQQFEWLCASLGTTLIHSKPYVPNGRGKIERFFRTVRTRFLSKLDINEISNIDVLNEQFTKWLNEDYQNKPHSALNNSSPLEHFMSNLSKLNLPVDSNILKENFFIRIKRKVKHDATLSIDKILYETDSHFSNSQVEIRYEPEWIGNLSHPLLIFKDDKKIGEARLVNFQDNSHRKRRGTQNTMKESTPNFNETIQSQEVEEKLNTPTQTISFKGFEGVN